MSTYAIQQLQQGPLAAERAAEAARVAKQAKQPAGESADSGASPFAALMDVINPLQHIPIVGSLYRHFTGDSLTPGTGVLGGALFGGLPGMVLGAINAVVDGETGRDMGEHMIALFTPEAEAPQLADASSVAAPPPAALNALPDIAQTPPATLNAVPITPVSAEKLPAQEHRWQNIVQRLSLDGEKPATHGHFTWQPRVKPHAAAPAAPTSGLAELPALTQPIALPDALPETAPALRLRPYAPYPLTRSSETRQAALDIQG